MQMEQAKSLYQKYFAAVYSVCFLYMKNQADACDMVQETFLRMLQGKFNYENEEKARAWLIVTASNCCKSQLKRSFRKKQVAYDAAVHDRGKEDPDNLLWRMVEELEEKYRLPVYLHYFEGYRSAEIAQMLHINASTVRNRLAKAREILRLELEEAEHPAGREEKDPAGKFVKMTEKNLSPNSRMMIEKASADNSTKKMRKAW